MFDVDRMIDLLEALEAFYKDANSSRGDMDGSSADPAHASTSLTAASTPPALLPPPQNLPTSVDLGTFRLQIPNPLNFPVPFPNPQSALVLSGGGGGGTRMGMGQPVDDERARDALTFVLSPEGSFFRDFLLDEIVKGLDAISREQVRACLDAHGRHTCRRLGGRQRCKSCESQRRRGFGGRSLTRPFRDARRFPCPRW